MAEKLGKEFRVWYYFKCPEGHIIARGLGADIPVFDGWRIECDFDNGGARCGRMARLAIDRFSKNNVYADLASCAVGEKGRVDIV